MKRIILILAAWASCLPAAYAKSEEPLKIPDARNVGIKKDGSRLSVTMDIDLSSLKVRGNRAVVLTPVLMKDGLKSSLDAIGIYGRRRYIYYQRENGKNHTADNVIIKASKKPDTYSYDVLLPWEDWMDGAALRMERCDF